MKVWLSMLTSSGVHLALGAAVVLNHFAAASTMHAYLLMDEGGRKGRGPIHASLHMPAASAIAATTVPTERHQHKRKLVARADATPSMSLQGVLPAAGRNGAPGEELSGSGGLGLQGSGTGRGPSLMRSSIGELDYTRDALGVGFQGQLTVDVVIDEGGRVIDARLLNPTGYALDDEVIAAAQAARYTPAVSADGQPMRAVAKLNFDFHIPEQLTR